MHTLQQDAVHFSEATSKIWVLARW